MVRQCANAIASDFGLLVPSFLGEHGLCTFLKRMLSGCVLRLFGQDDDGEEREEEPVEEEQEQEEEEEEEAEQSELRFPDELLESLLLRRGANRGAGAVDASSSDRESDLSSSSSTEACMMLHQLSSLQMLHQLSRLQMLHQLSSLQMLHQNHLCYVIANNAMNLVLGASSASPLKLLMNKLGCGKRYAAIMHEDKEQNAPRASHSEKEGVQLQSDV